MWRLVGIDIVKNMREAYQIIFLSAIRNKFMVIFGSYKLYNSFKWITLKYS